MSEIGKIAVVATQAVGTTLVGSHASGVTELNVYDRSEFDEAGGTLTIGDETYTYTAWSGEAEDESLDLSAPTTSPYEDGDRVLVSPSATETIATVTLDDEGEGLEVVVPHALVALLAEGIRDPGEGETVELQDSDDGWTIVGVIKETALIDDDAIDSLRVSSDDNYVEISSDGTQSRLRLGLNTDPLNIGTLVAFDTSSSTPSTPVGIGLSSPGRLELYASEDLTGSVFGNVDLRTVLGDLVFSQDPALPGPLVERMRIRGTDGRVTLPGILDDAAASGTDLVITASGRIAMKSSTRRVKSEVRLANLPADVINRLRPVTFRYKDGVDGETDDKILGLLAEDAHAVCPLLTNQNAAGEPVSLDSQALITALIASVQRLEARVAELEAGRS